MRAMAAVEIRSPKPTKLKKSSKRKWERWHPCRRLILNEQLAGKDAGAPRQVTTTVFLQLGFIPILSPG